MIWFKDPKMDQLPILITILIRVHPNQCSKNSHSTVLTTRGGSDLSLPLSHFQSWFEEDSNQGRDAETHGKSAGTYGDVRTGRPKFSVTFLIKL